MNRTIIIGGGVAGLASAALLAREGHQVHLLERNSRLGGRAGLIERDGFRFDTGPSWYLMPRVFDHFFALMGTSTAEQLDLEFLAPSYRVFSEPANSQSDSESFTIPLGRHRVLDTFEKVEKGSSAILERYLSSARRTTQLAEQYFLYNPFTRPRTLASRDILRSAFDLKDLLGTSLESYVAQRFQHPVLRQVLGYPAVFLGTNPSDAPAMYHLMSALDLDEGVRYPIGGFWQLIERLEAIAVDAGVTITRDAEVTRILTHRSARLRKKQARGVVWSDSCGVQHRLSADTVVSAADLHHTETRLLSQPDRTYPSRWWKKRTSGPGAVIAMLGVRGMLPQLPHHSLFFTRNWHENFEAIFGRNRHIPNPASIYVCKPSATDPGVAPSGHENLFVLIPVPADTELGAGGADGRGDQAVELATDRAIEQIATWAGIDDLKERIVVRETLGPADFANDYYSWRGGMLGPAHILSQSAMFRAQNASKKVRGLYYAGATTAPGVGVPMCLISAELVLKRIRGDHSPGPLPVPERAVSAV